MGLFDTIEFPNPIKCNECGKEHSSTQTKMFENLLNFYTVGDFLPGNMITGVLKESLYCNHDDEEKESSWDQEIYLAVWHNILIGIFEDYDKAENKVRTFSQGDLYLLYQTLHEDRNKYRFKFNAVKHWTEDYIEYQQLTPKEREKLLREEHSLLNIHMKSFVEGIEESKTPFKDYLKELDKRGNYNSQMFF